MSDCRLVLDMARCFHHSSFCRSNCQLSALRPLLPNSRSIRTDPPYLCPHRFILSMQIILGVQLAMSPTNWTVGEMLGRVHFVMTVGMGDAERAAMRLTRLVLG